MRKAPIEYYGRELHPGRNGDRRLPDFSFISMRLPHLVVFPFAKRHAEVRRDAAAGLHVQAGEGDGGGGDRGDVSGGLPEEILYGFVASRTEAGAAESLVGVGIRRH